MGYQDIRTSGSKKPSEKVDATSDCPTWAKAPSLASHLPEVSWHALLGELDNRRRYNATSGFQIGTFIVASLDFIKYSVALYDSMR